MAQGTFLFEYFLAARRRARRAATRRFFRRRFLRLLLRQECSSHGQSCDPENYRIPFHDAPSSKSFLSPSDEATLELSYSLRLWSQFPLGARHMVQVPLLHALDFRTFDPCNT